MFDNIDAIYRVFSGTDPAANVEIAQEVATRAGGSVLWVAKITLVTDATVATRTVTFKVDDGTNVLWQRISPATQAASLTRVYYLYQDLVVEDAAFDGNGEIKLRIPLAVARFRPGWRLVTSTANRQATDNFGAPLLAVNDYKV